MLSITVGMRVYLHRAAVDMRKSFDGLFGIVNNDLHIDVRQGGLFLFINKRRTHAKVMYWDSDGIAIWMKRLEQGSYQHPKPSDGSNCLIIDAGQLHLLLTGIDLRSIKRRKRYASPKATSNTSAV
jgi:transposase